VVRAAGSAVGSLGVLEHAMQVIVARATRNDPREFMSMFSSQVRRSFDG
jgi:hypothetical protein